ncbi:hypothetical protein TNCV_1726371 [Trichonephila clavipes]|nr:hypothetical protein TNCV_1726371 [Trichonephila clavipes]
MSNREIAMIVEKKEYAFDGPRNFEYRSNGYFDNAWWPGILHLLRGFKVPKNIFCLIKSFLQCRSADLTLGNVTKNRVLEKRLPTRDRDESFSVEFNYERSSLQYLKVPELS